MTLPSRIQSQAQLLQEAVNSGDIYTAIEIADEIQGALTSARAILAQTAILEDAPPGESHDHPLTILAEKTAKKWQKRNGTRQISRHFIRMQADAMGVCQLDVDAVGFFRRAVKRETGKSAK